MIAVTAYGFLLNFNSKVIYERRNPQLM